MNTNQNVITNLGSPGETSITPNTPSLAGNESLSTLSTASIPSVSDESQVNLPINEDAASQESFNPSEASMPQEDQIAVRLRNHYTNISDINEELH